MYIVAEIVSKDKSTSIVSDGKYLYNVSEDGEYVDRRLPVTEDLEPAIQIVSGSSYVMKEKEPNTFYCDLDNIGAYMQTLTTNGYVEQERYRDSKMIDYKYYNGDTFVRVLWFVNGIARVYALDSRNNVSTLPYINGEGKA